MADLWKLFTQKPKGDLAAQSFPDIDVVLRQTLGYFCKSALYRWRQDLKEAGTSKFGQQDKLWQVQLQLISTQIYKKRSSK